jgi:NADH-quinone oxidoreductase subunit J
LVADTPTLVVFIITSILVIGSALMVVLNRHPIYSALFLVLTFLGLSVFFLQLQAPFIAAVQIIVYAGAIMVLFLFVIMLLGEDKPLTAPSKLGPQAPLGVVISLALVGVLSYSILGRGPSVAATPGAPPEITLVGAAGTPEVRAEFGNVKALGNTLFTQYLFAFEATSIVLLVAMVGVVVLAKRRL